jgi:XRE family transcriptional regulator of biofilm formation
MEEKQMKKKEKTIGEKIKAWRKKKDLTQDALTKKADIPYTTLAKIESDVIRNPSLQTITKIANGLGITLDDLVKG